MRVEFVVALVIGAGLLIQRSRSTRVGRRVACWLAHRLTVLRGAPLAESLPLTYVISLARRPAKRKTVLERIAAAGLECVVVIDAVDGRELSPEALEARGVVPYAGWKLEDSPCRFFSRALKWGEIGCGLSHHTVWKLTSVSTEPVLVVEDDVDFLPNFAAMLSAALAELRDLVEAGETPLPDLLYLTRRAMKPASERLVGSRRQAGEGGARVQLVAPAFSYKTTAYMLWPTGAVKLLASGYLRKVIPVDDFLNVLFCTHEVEPGMARPDLDALFADAPRLRVLAVRPQLARERRGISDTENSKVM